MRTFLPALVAAAFAASAAAHPCAVPGDHATIQAAFDDAACDPIQLAAGTYSGSFTIHRPMTVHGAGPGVTILDGQNLGRVLTIVPASGQAADPTSVIVLTGMTIQHGKAHGSGVRDLAGGGIADFLGPLVLDDCDVSHNAASTSDNRTAGGGIESQGGDLSLIRCTVTFNTSGGYGGGIDAEQGYTVIVDSTISNNSARTDAAGIESGGLGLAITRTTIANNTGGGTGGGIDDEGGPLSIDHSVVTGNRAAEYGGGVNSVGGGMVMIACTIANNTIGDGDGGGVDQAGNYLVLKRSTISGNHLTNGNGGGLAVTPDSGGLVLIEDSTFAGNTNGGNGGGVFVGLRGGSNPGIFSSTIAGNSAHAGGGLFVERPSGGSSRLNVAVSLVSGNSGGDCAAGALLLSLGHNIAKDSTCAFTASGDRKGTDPKLGALAVSFPGETATLPLLAGSPAIDAGDAPATPTDQRGVTRGGTHPDVGAFEVADPAAVVVPVEEVDLRLPGTS